MSLNTIIIILIIALSQTLTLSPAKSDEITETPEPAQIESSISSIPISEIPNDAEIFEEQKYYERRNDSISNEIYSGYVCFLKQTDDYTVDVYIRPNENCVLQAFDIYIDSDGHSYQVESRTGESIIQYGNHFMSIANGLEMEMKANTNYKIASITFENDGSCFDARVTRADLAIAYTPLPPVMDDQYLEFDPIKVGN